MKNNFSTLLIMQVILTLAILPIWPVDSAHQDRIYLVYGSLVSLIQFGLLFFVWWRIFMKKKIAPSVTAVVIKYALLGLAFWYVSPLQQSEIKALVMGVLLMPITVVLFAFLNPWLNKWIRKTE
jgi:hypothetical protein